MSKRLTNKEFLDRVPFHIKTKFKFLNEYTTSMDFILLEDELGIVYSQRPHWILSGRNPGIVSAVDKTDAIKKIVLNNFKDKLSVDSEYISHVSNIVVVDKLGVKYNTTPANLKDGKYPIFSSAIDNNQAFIKHSILIHGDKYDYSMVDVNNARQKAIIICPKHGAFHQNYTNHVINKQGCRRCFFETNTINKTSNTYEFIKKAKLTHGDKYDYSKSIYTLSSNKIEVLCNTHGSFFPMASNHIQGSGCPSCGRETMGGLGYNKSVWIEKFNKSKVDKKCIVYILSLHNEEESFIKIGRTFSGVHHRFGLGRKKRMPYNYNVIAEISGSPEFVYDLEKKLHFDFKKYRYIPKIKFKGFTECFSTNVLNYLKYEEYKK